MIYPIIRSYWRSTMKKILIYAAAVLLVIGGGCRRAEETETENDNVMGGGTVDHTDAGAPKTIESDEIVSFSASFYVNDDYAYGGSWYAYSLWEENGKLMLEESRAYRISTEADASLLQEVQKVIAKHELTKLNGIDKHTAGLPEQFQPCYLSALYASGEKLYFSFNNEPEAGWAKELKKLFNRVFSEAGYEETKEDENNYVIDHFSLEFQQGDPVTYSYGMITMENEQVYFFRNVYDRAASASLSFEFADMENGLLEQLSQKIEELDLQKLHEGSHHDPDHTQDFLEIHVDYATGRQIYGEYEADEIPEIWNDNREELTAFLDAYLQENLIAGSYQEMEEMISASEDEAVRKELEYQIGLTEAYEGWQIRSFEKEWEDDGTVSVSLILQNGTEEKQLHCHLRIQGNQGTWEITDFRWDEES